MSFRKNCLRELSKRKNLLFERDKNIRYNRYLKSIDKLLLFYCNGEYCLLLLVTICRMQKLNYKKLKERNEFVGKGNHCLFTCGQLYSKYAIRKKELSTIICSESYSKISVL